MKLLKKIVFGILIASALFALAYFLPNLYNIGYNPTQIYENYTRYIIFLYISIILLYACATTHSRLSTVTMVTLLLANFFRLAGFFTQNVLGINTMEFYSLTILFLLALVVTHIRYRIRYPLIIFIGIPFIIILLNHALPLYPNAPDIEGFYASQSITLSIQTKDDAKILQEAETKITIKTEGKEDGPQIEKTILFNEAQEPTTLGDSNTQILFSSKTGIQNSYAHITFPQGTILTIYPQSAITINMPEVSIIQGRINIYTPEGQSGYLTLTGDLKNIFTNNTGNIQYLIDEFLRKKNTYLINQIGGEIMLNSTVDACIGRYINIANSATKIAQNICSSKFIQSLKPGKICVFSSFDNNKLNYDEFHTHLDYKKSTTYTAPKGSTERIARDTQKGRNSTNVKAWRDIIKNSFNSIFDK